MEGIGRMAETARYDGRWGSSTRPTKAHRWYESPIYSSIFRGPDRTPRRHQAQGSVCSRSLIYRFVPEYERCGLDLRPLFQSHTPLLTLPSKTKINMETLSYYPYSNRLTATQLMSLHLLRYRPAPGCESADPHFGPYISILPRDFGDHPLTWIVHRTLGAGSREEHKLLCLLPPSVLSDLVLLERRFWRDWEALRLYLVCLRIYPITLMTLVRTACLIFLHHGTGHEHSQN